MNKKYLIIHGPNLKMLGNRELNYYGTKTLEEINSEIQRQCEKYTIECEFFQSNHEGNIIDKIEISTNLITGIIINPGAFSHYSLAIRDAIQASCKPTIEVHMSNIYNREEFRKQSVIAPVCIGQITGFKEYSYFLAVTALNEYIN